MRIWVFLLSLMAAGSALAAPATTVFRDVNLLVMDGSGVLAGRDVVVRDDRIVSVSEHQPTSSYADARVIDGSGLYLMPGLVDMHAHMPDGSGEDWSLDAYFQSYLDAGVTTIRSMRGHPQQLMWRAEVLDGSRLGPNLLLSAPPLLREQAADPNLAALIRGYAAASYDFLKILGGFNQTQFAALVEYAGQADLAITGHIPEAGLAAGVDAGMRSVEHLSAFTKLRLEQGENALRQLTREMNSKNVYVCPTFETYEISKALIKNEDVIALRQVKGLPTSVVENWKTYLHNFQDRVTKNPEAYAIGDDYLSKHLETGRIMMEENVGFLVSPSQWRCLIPGAAMLIEMRHFEAMGMKREAILMACTTVAAKAMGAEDEFGQVRTNQRADLLLLKANPLENLDALTQVSGVMVKGRWLPRDAGKS